MGKTIWSWFFFAIAFVLAPLGNEALAQPNNRGVRHIGNVLQNLTKKRNAGHIETNPVLSTPKENNTYMLSNALTDIPDYAQRGTSQRSEHMIPADAQTHDSWSINEQFDRDPRLPQRLAKAFPPDTNIYAEADGFKDFVQFIATIQASNNLGIPFHQMKAAVLSGLPLQDAIKQFRPNVNAAREAQRAEREAKKVKKQVYSQPAQPQFGG